MTDTTNEPTYSFKLGGIDTSGSSVLSKAAATTQLDNRNVATNVGGGIEPPYPPHKLAAFLELNETHATAIQKKSRWEVGFGVDLVPTAEAGDDANESDRETLEEFWFGDDSRWKIGPEGTAKATPTEVLELARQDYHSAGWSALEILTSNDGTPVGLAHVPAPTVRVRKKLIEEEGEDSEPIVRRGVGYVQSKGGKTVYFGEAGDRYGDDPRFVDRENGDVADDARDLEHAPANELIFIPNPSPLATYYGIPDWISAIRTIGGDHAAKEFNRDFFEHNAIPHYAVVVTGGELTARAREDLKEVIHNLKGSPHRTVILEAEKFVQNTLDDGEQVNVSLEPLGAQNDEDMSFLAYREWNEAEVIKVHEVPPILIGQTETANRSNSKEQINDFAQDVIKPEQEKFAARLYEILHKRAFEVDDWTVEFELRGADNRQRDAEIAKTRIEASQGTLTVNEARTELGLDPVDDDDLGDEYLFALSPSSAPGHDAEVPPEFLDEGGENDEDDDEDEEDDDEVEAARSRRWFEGAESPSPGEQAKMQRIGKRDRSADDELTQTLTIQREYAQLLRGRYAEIMSAIREAVVEEDIFGLDEADGAVLRSDFDAEPPNQNSFSFASSDDKHDAFMNWLDEQQDEGILETISTEDNEFVRRAYERGAEHGDNRIVTAGGSPPDTDISAMFDLPIHQNRIEQLYSRNFENLESITADVASDVSETLADGLSRGVNPVEMGRDLTNRVDSIGRHQATLLARTEIMNSHNSAAVARYQEAGIEQVEVLTADPCDLCEAVANDGPYTPDEAEGLVPGSTHPNCRCSISPLVGR